MRNRRQRKKTIMQQDPLNNIESIDNNKEMSLDKAQSSKKQTMFLEDDSNNLSINNLNSNDIINDKYRLLRIFPVESGEGEFYIAEYNGEEYIVKFYNLNYKYNEEKVKILQKIKSKYIVRIVDYGVYNQRNYEVMPYYSNGDLTRYKLPKSYIKNVLVPNVIDALNDIHSNKVIHRDIKPSNIFLSNDKSYTLLSDFGISSVLREKETSKKTGQAKTIEYSAIETFNGIVNSASDYYSLGITIMELLTGKTSYEGLSTNEIIDRKFSHKLSIPLEEDDEFYYLIKGLTNMNYKSRWGYEEVKKWLNGEFVDVIEDNIDFLAMRPYKFNGKQITSKKDLALELSLNWKDGIKDLRRGYLSEYFKDKDIEITRKLDDFIEKIDNIKIKNINRNLLIDIEYFKAINFIYNDNPLIWRGENLINFENLNEIENLIEIMKNYPNVNGVDEFILKGPLEYYLEIKNYPMEIKESVNNLVQLSKVSKQGYDRACYGFALLNNNDFKYNGEVFNNLKQLIDYISNNTDRYSNIADDLLKSNYFNMWLRKLGYEDIVLKHID